MADLASKGLELLPGLLLGGLGNLVQFLQNRRTNEVERARVADEAQKAEADALESSWSSWRQARAYLDANFTEMNELRAKQNQALLDQIRVLEGKVVALEMEVARLGHIESRCSILEDENQRLRGRLRAHGEEV